MKMTKTSFIILDQLLSFFLFDKWMLFFFKATIVGFVDWNSPPTMMSTLMHSRG